MLKPFLEQYGGQTIGQLIAMQDTHRVDSIILAIEMGIEQTLASREKSELSEAELTVLAVEGLEREVNNGGYQQFFINSTCEYVGVIVAALERIGCPACAAITADAIEILDLPGDTTTDAISNLASDLPEELADRLDECDHRYFGNREDIGARLFSFVEKNPSKIRLPNSG